MVRCGTGWLRQCWARFGEVRQVWSGGSGSESAPWDPVWHGEAGKASFVELGIGELRPGKAGWVG